MNEVNPNDPKYLAGLVQGLQQQRDQANNTIAHLAAVANMKDAQIEQNQKALTELQRRFDELSQEAGLLRAKVNLCDTSSLGNLP